MTTRRRRTYSDEAREEENWNTFGKPHVTTTYVERYDSDMTCRDRTNEFLSAVKSFQSRQGNGIPPQSQNHRKLQHSEFTTIARKIGYDISNTFAKLEKLTILAKRKSLFDDKPVEIQELTYIIKQDINNLNKQIAQLQQLVKMRAHKSGRHLQSHSSQVVVSLQSKLATMSSDFKQVLELRTQNLKEQKTRREQFSQGPVAASLPPSATNGNTGSVLLQDEKTSYGGLGGDVAINMDDVQKDRYQQQLQLIDEQDSYIQSRASTMESIEATIVELGSIFQQLAHMVKEQEEQVQRIDQNVEDTHMNVEAAHGELLKYFQSVTSNRWLMIKIFVVLIVFFIVFVVFMA
ncbi:syntaxin-5-like [Ptychodera flava]|uniref:syntaxin-5-like n=1 Tax=Ptychodera flava TaxID=63121 RepID=UPI00396A83C7